MTSPAGWHPDPLPPTPGQPPLLRYWDGTRWTEHTSPAPAQQYHAPAYGGGKQTTTPDGVPLAGWWHRVGAYLIDSLVTVVVTGVLGAKWYAEIFDVYRDYMREVMDDAEAGRQTTTSAFDLQGDIAGPLAIITLITIGVGLVYHVGFLMWKQGTPGKLLTGLRVRRRDEPGPMPLTTCLLRWVGQFGYAVLGLIPFVGNVFGLYSLLDHLWPLWDDKRQAIHDKIAKTNVVRVR